MSILQPLPIRILLVADHTMMRTGLRLFLENQPDTAVVGEAADGKEALAVASQVQPDIILLDLDLNGESVLDLIPMLFAVAPQAHVLILTGVRDPTIHQRAIRLGARGLVLKEKTAEVLLQAIVKVHAGEAWLERTMMANVLDALGHTSRRRQIDPEAAKIATLTAREHDVIALIGEGLKNRQVATRLHISETTVRHHLTVIFDKLGVSDRLELVVYAYRHGLVKLPQ